MVPVQVLKVKGGCQQDAREYVEKARGGKHGHGNPPREAGTAQGRNGSSWAGKSAYMENNGKSMVYNPACVAHS